ncbi:L-ascorbate metabolism protein UlaG (beta-lactamase superfamily) [Hoeflea marina]|uniref:L-ascorbate metabolism protein UlaG (Beta-lactamase superfamily) n=1 Tax=Hoeflea marina TaxID=274592 RepID=A0A317PKS8_9HYPH|nr:MBL fold metallo-hydrolase [Hoeflea marina]PWW01555.1 L-ascorbate metabolism protein UlaG (beta-lactamase superfamily) [Hoeflea marina]
MTISRRHLIRTTAAAAGAILIMPYAARAAAKASDVFQSAAGDITIHPVDHASFVMETPQGVIYCDPVGDAAQYSDLPKPNLILVTHEHGDHYNAETLTALMGEGVELITNPAVNAMLPEALKSGARQLSNGESTEWKGVSIDAIAAYNTTEERKNFHPEGRDNGYVLGFEGFRVYISGDTENTPEMKALEAIDVAFLCMNLPFTMDVAQAADAVSAFKPKVVYPYHYRGKDGGTQDPAEFAKLVGESTEVKIVDWYA